MGCGDSRGLLTAEEAVICSAEKKLKLKSLAVAEVCSTIKRFSGQEVISESQLLRICQRLVPDLDDYHVYKHRFFGQSFFHADPHGFSRVKVSILGLLLSKGTNEDKSRELFYIINPECTPRLDQKQVESLVQGLVSVSVIYCPLLVKVMRLGREKLTLILSPKKLVQVADMAETRYFPGVIRYGYSVYAFGGFKAAASSEKYCLKTDQWAGLPLMAAAKSAFTPVLHSGLIYLPEVNEGSCLFEVFNTAAQQFSSIAPSLPFTDFASIAFIYREELVILDDMGRRAKLPLLPQTEFRNDSVELREVECCAQSGPVVVGRAVYFVQYSYGELCKFSPDRDVFKITLLN